MQSKRIFNESRNYWLKHRRAVEGVQNCVYAWVKFGVSVRDLTLQEMIAARDQRTGQRKPLPWAELPYCVFRLADQGAVIRERICAYEANQFAELAVT